MFFVNLKEFQLQYYDKKNKLRRKVFNQIYFYLVGEDFVRESGGLAEGVQQKVVVYVSDVIF